MAGHARWGLKARLFVPLVGLAVVSVLGVAVVEDLADRRHTTELIEQRGTSTRDRVIGLLQERLRAEEIFTQLVAEQPRVAVLVEMGDAEGLRDILASLADDVSLDYVGVRASDGRQILQLDLAGAPAPGFGSEHSLPTGPPSSVPVSTILVSDAGPAVFASAPISGTHGIVGAITVGDVIDRDVLKELKGRDPTELAVYRRGRLVATTVEDRGLAQALGAIGGPSDAPIDVAARLNPTLDPYNIRATGAALPGDATLVILVRTGDLVVAAWERAAAGVAGMVLVMAILLALYYLVAQDVTRPLQAVLSTTWHLVRGRYNRRVASSSIREVDELGVAINHLGAELEVRVAELARRAFHDPLTGLANRAMLHDRIEQALARTERTRMRVGMIYLDLDNFKVVNDHLGHEVGDQLLVAVAQRLEGNLRLGDTAARMGGDEFVLLLQDVEDLSVARQVAERTVERLQQPFMLAGHEVVVGASVGTTLSHSSKDLPDELIREADAAMYQAKTNGKARYEVFDRDLQPRIPEEVERRWSAENGGLALS